MKKDLHNRIIDALRDDQLEDWVHELIDDMKSAIQDAEYEAEKYEELYKTAESEVDDLKDEVKNKESEITDLEDQIWRLERD
jgi:predicted  nucleic acid-binding Zn-ribbon protein